MGMYRTPANSPRNFHLSFAPSTDLEGSADSIAMLEKNPLVKPYLQKGKKIPVTILGATGVVGQRFLR
ncbi:MAG: hypothetical protein LWX00_03115, partial [Spirochaetia bacterium]|nr:hypothetical protein [Spirochaetia bacterium]